MSTTTDTAQPGTLHKVTIEKLTFGGSGLTHVEGLPIFVPDSIPGQQAQILIVKRKDGYAEAKVQKLIRKAKDEVPARCPHFHDCGGFIFGQIRRQLFRQSRRREQLRRIALEPVLADQKFKEGPQARELARNRSLLQAALIKMAEKVANKNVIDRVENGVA